MRAVTLVLLALWGCSGRKDSEVAANTASSPTKDDALVRVDPPFAVEGDLHGLWLQWFDADGVHVAERRSDIPAAQRERVRVASLRVIPGAQPDGDSVYVADVRSRTEGDGYPVFRVPRTRYDAWVAAAQPKGEVSEPQVIVYGTSWCPACRAAVSYLEEQGIPFESKDVEADRQASARAASLRQQAGIKAGSVPVIEIGTHVLSGFDAGRIQAALALTGQARD